MSKTISPPGRTPFISCLNTGLSVARRAGVMQDPALDREELMNRAAEATGLDDFGGDWFERPFQILLDAIHKEAQLNEAGRLSAAKQFGKVLQDRLWAQQWFARHPEILSRPLPHPVIVVGPMRSGTTRMHRLLASDHRLTHMRSFETISPVPQPGFMPGGKDPRPDLARRIQRLARLANPRTLSIHPTGPYETEEELGLLVNSFWGMKHDAQWHVPSYGRWCEAADARPAYFQMARLLRLISWSQQESSLRPWVLKTPQHMLDIDALLATFPDARLIVTHRDPLAVVASAASLAWNQTMIYSDHADPRAVGREWLHKSCLQIERMCAARRNIDPDRIIDVHYADMDADWERAMGRVYRFLDMDIAPALPKMRAYVKRSAQLKRRPHHYSLEQFGLTSEMVMDRLGNYAREFDVRLESADRRRA